MRKLMLATTALVTAAAVTVGAVAPVNAAAKIKVPVTLILGERDMMTPQKSGKALGAALEDARTVVLPGAGHMMMLEQPEQTLAALRG